MLEAIRAFDPLTQRSLGKVAGFELGPVSEVMLDEAAVERFRAGYLSAFGARDRRPAVRMRSAPAGRSRAWSTGCRCSTSAWSTCSTTSSRTRLISFDPLADEAIAARHATIGEHYAARREPPEAARAMGLPLPAARRPMSSTSASTGWRRCSRPRAGRSFSVRAARRMRPRAASRWSTSAAARRAISRPSAPARTVNLFDAVARSPARRAGGRQADPDRRCQRGLARAARAGCWPITASRACTGAERWRRAGDRPGERAGAGRAAPRARLRDRRPLGPRPRRTSSATASAGRPAGAAARPVHPRGRRARARAISSSTTTTASAATTAWSRSSVGGAPHDCLRLHLSGRRQAVRAGREYRRPVALRLGRGRGAARQARRPRLADAQGPGQAAHPRDRGRADRDRRRARHARAATRLAPPQGIYEEFAARFPYDETEDQARAIEAVLDDLASGQPMDRLICGDVGFGKTEVALRAAFVAAMQRQAGRGRRADDAAGAPALPASSRERFAGLPVRIEQLSRFVAGQGADADQGGPRRRARSTS